MPLSVGDKLGFYVILAPIGAGGMGEVYRARDTKLDREVAIKVLPHLLAQDPERLARFEREAKVLASLNHPSIAQIYGVEESNNLRALVMELVPGETLKGPLPLETALNYAKQIADALEAAHEKGITHRDLKPANIMITPTGVVKVLDFGLAFVAQDPASGSVDPINSPTLTMAATQAGMIMGTAAYMSPEQASGKPVDKRADIWSFGVVLWEILTGERLFDGETVSHTLADVLRAEIDFAKLPGSTPSPIRELLRRCLDRDLKTRLRDIGEARIVMSRPTGGTEITAPSRSRLSWVVWVAAAALAVIAAGGSFVHFREQPPEVRVLYTSILPPDNTAFAFNAGVGLPALSPDGRRIVFGARTAGGKSPLWTRSLDVPTAQPLAGTEGAIFPFWSPDSRFIAFFADGKLKTIDASGGPALALAEVALGRGGSWSPEGVIVFSAGTDNGHLLRVSSAGGAGTAGSSEGGSPPRVLPARHTFL